MALCLRVDWQLYNAARQQGQEWAYALWLLAQALDSGGSVSMSVLEDVTRGYLLFGSDCQRNLRRHIKAAIRSGWFSERPSKDGPKLAYIGRRRVCEMLGVKRLNGTRVKVPVTALRRLRAFRAAMLDVWHRRRGKRPAYSQSVEEATGVSRASQWRYREYNTVTVQKNESIAQYIKGDVVADGKGGNPNRGEYAYRDKRGVVWHVKPMAPVYLSGLSACKDGRRRKVNKRLERKARGEPKQAPNTARVTFARLYHRTVKKAQQALREHGRTTYAYLGTRHGRGRYYRCPALQ